MTHSITSSRIAQRKYDLDPFVKISRHPIRATEKNLFIATICKTVNSAVLKKPADDTTHSNPVTYSANARPQGANTTNVSDRFQLQPAMHDIGP